MVLRLDIKIPVIEKLLSTRSERVKSVDFHPTENWVLASLYNGQVYVWDYITQATVKTFEICDKPARKNWFLSAADDNVVRVFNYNTSEKVTNIEAHSDYIRSIAVHPSRPFVLTSSDDMTIKLWDWEKGWKNTMVFEGHSHYVMMVVFNPKDSNTFASASLDRTVKVWNLSSTSPNYTLEGHEKGVNCVEYYHGNDKPYLISGADDKNVKIWDYQNKSCVQTLSGHSNNVSAVCFHTELPIIVSASEDGMVKLWHSNTFRLENTLNYGLERAWALAYLKGSNMLAFGFDDGCVAIKLGREEPSISMDPSGKIVWTKHFVVLTANVKTGDNFKDGEILNLPVKELGNSEIYPQSLQHSPNGRFVVVCGDGEYIIYTALAWRNKAYGSALEFAWDAESNQFALRESSSKVKICKNFKESSVIKTPYSAEQIYSGELLGVRSGNFLCFYEWETSRLVRRIDVQCRNVVWCNNTVAIIGDESFYILRYHAEAFQAYVDSGMDIPEDGVEASFEFVAEYAESVSTCCWVSNCFIFTSIHNRLNYVVGTEVNLLAHFDRPLYILGFKDSRVFLSDKDANITSYFLSVAVVDYQAAILSKDLETAESLLPQIPSDQMNKIARFLDSQGLFEMALKLSTDNDHKFELAIKLQQIDVAEKLIVEGDVTKYQLLGDCCLKESKMDKAEGCYWKAQDYSSLLLIYHCTANAEGLKRLGEKAKGNISFMCYFLLQDIEKCIDILTASQRFSEAAMMALTYKPTSLGKAMTLWKNALNKKVGVYHPLEEPEHFPDLDFAFQGENFLKSIHGTSADIERFVNLKADFKNKIKMNTVESEWKSFQSVSPVKLKQEESPAKSPLGVSPAKSPQSESPAKSPIRFVQANSPVKLVPQTSPVKSASPAKSSQSASPSIKSFQKSPAKSNQEADFDVDDINIDDVDVGNLKINDDDLDELLK